MEIEIINVVGKNIINPKNISYESKPGKTQYIPVNVWSQSSVGIGKSVISYSTRYETKTTTTTTTWIKHHDEIITYGVDVHYKSEQRNGILPLICPSKSRQESIMKSLENKKYLKVRFLFGYPVIDEIGYNFWLESPIGLATTIGVPFLIMAYILPFFL